MGQTQGVLRLQPALLGMPNGRDGHDGDAASNQKTPWALWSKMEEKGAMNHTRGGENGENGQHVGHEGSWRQDGAGGMQPVHHDVQPTSVWEAIQTTDLTKVPCFRRATLGGLCAAAGAHVGSFFIWRCHLRATNHAVASFLVVSGLMWYV